LAASAARLYAGKGGNFRQSIGSDADPNDDLPTINQSKTKPLQSDRVFLSVIQNFGPNDVDSYRWIKVDSEGPINHPHSQMTIVMRGIGPEAYSFCRNCEGKRPDSEH
jgi:hypothetical protein